MGEVNVWGAQRYTTFIAVLAIHAAVLALLLMTSRTQILSTETNYSVEVLFLPPAKTPKVRAESARVQRLSTDTAISVTLAGLDSSSLAPPSAGSNGDAPAVDWTAEAHRALQAFEIRREHPAGSEVLGASPWVNWWPQGGHHAGDRFKTESGDWIVWIDAYCYQVAVSSSSGGGLAAGPAPPTRTICPCRPKASGAEVSNQMPVCKQGDSQ
jgi:hypothetical protein